MYFLECFFYFVENMSFMVSKIKKIVVNCTNFLTNVTLVRKLVQFTTLCSLKLMRVRLVTASFNQFTTSFLSDNLFCYYYHSEHFHSLSKHINRKIYNGNEMK